MNASEKQQAGSPFYAALLVAGTCIGGGMLALPDVTGIGGFLPSLLIVSLCWAMMTITGLLLIEASLWLPEGAHFISMSSTFLGPWGKGVSWILYLFISYASLVAYTAEGGGVIADVMQALGGVTLGKVWGALLFLLVFGFVVDWGARVVGRVNALLMLGMLISYVILCLGGIGLIRVEHLLHRQWGGSLLAIPFFLTSFSHQTMAPSLTPYLQRNGKKLGWAIVGGTTVALLFYVVWLFVVLGMIPFEGADGLASALQKGERATKLFAFHVPGWIATTAEFFAFFAIVTSFLGIGLGLFDFLADGLSMAKRGWGKVKLALLIMIPTLLFATQFERIFLLAIDTSGGYGDSILSGLIPVLMVWMGRYVWGYSHSFRVFGGKPLLVIVFLFFLFTLALELAIHSGFVCSLFDYCESLPQSDIPLPYTEKE